MFYSVRAESHYPSDGIQEFIESLDSIESHSTFNRLLKQTLIDCKDLNTFKQIYKKCTLYLSEIPDSELIKPVYKMLEEWHLEILLKDQANIQPRMLLNEYEHLIVEKMDQREWVVNQQLTRNLIQLMLQNRHNYFSIFNDPNRLFKVMKSFLDSGYVPTMTQYEMAMECLAAKKMAQECEIIIEYATMHHQKLSIKLYNLLLHALQDQKMRLKQLGQLERRIRIVEQETAELIILLYLSNGFYEHAIQKFTDMRLMGFTRTISFYNAVIKKLSTDPSAAQYCIKDLYHSMRRECIPDLTTWHNLLDCCIITKDILACITFCQSMHEIDETIRQKILTIAEFGDDVSKRILLEILE